MKISFQKGSAFLSVVVLDLRELGDRGQLGPTSGLGVRRDKAALSSGCKSHPAIAPAGSSRSSYGGDEIAEAFGMRVTNW